MTIAITVPSMDSAIQRACDQLHAQHVPTIEIRQVGAGVKAARAEVEAVRLPLAMTCDWGDCDEQANYIRYCHGLGMLGWLPVCDEHRGARLELVDPSEGKP